METFKYVLDTLAVVGTWGAVVVALKLSRTAAKKAASDAEARAGLVAAHHLDHVRNIWLLARKLAALLPPNREMWSTRADLLSPIVDIERTSLTVMNLDVIAQLMPLPNHCASRLSRSIGELSTLVENIDAMHDVWPSMNPAFRASWIDRWAAQADLIALNLKTVIDECANAANTHAPSITAAELGLE
ncbi:hypothetical protein [Variovorax sp.]|uniref:hypothetical protein n=1 Tax=Variovorax sp. TaxID=1871043 RepID=UPI0037DA33FF